MYFPAFQLEVDGLALGDACGTYAVAERAAYRKGGHRWRRSFSFTAHGRHRGAGGISAPLFAEKGYRTLAPAWQCKERPVDEQLADPASRLAEVGIPEIVAHYQAMIRKLPEPQVLIGHSFGGLIVQLLLDQGYGAAGYRDQLLCRRLGCALSRSVRAVKKLWSLFGGPSSWGIVPRPERDADERALRRA